MVALGESLDLSCNDYRLISVAVAVLGRYGDDPIWR
jgi:hypothetical protein